MFRYIKLTAAAVGLLLFALNAFGQGTTGQIAGTVTDPNGAVVAGATVDPDATGAGCCPAGAGAAGVEVAAGLRGRRLASVCFTP